MYANSKGVLNFYFRERAKHPLSEYLPENPFNNDEKHLKDYRKEMLDYEIAHEDVLAYAQQNPNKKKFDFTNPNESWKIHLNVAPESVKAVSEYLKKWLRP